MNGDQDRMLREIHNESTLRLPNRRDVPGDDTRETVLGYAANSDKFSLHALTLLADLVTRMDRIEAAIKDPKVR
jgi:hypothetical protein